MITGFFLTALPQLNAQDQRIADSLAQVYHESNLHDSSKLELLRNLSFNEVRNLGLSLQYAEELIALSKRLNNNLYLHRGYFQKGNKKRLVGDLDEAITAYFKSIEAAEKEKYLRGIGMCLSAIADIYSISNNHKNAMLYYRKAIVALQQSKDSVVYGSAIYNAGDEFLNRNMFDSALLYFKRAGIIFDKINYASGKAYNLGNLGMVYANLGNSALAEQYINSSIKMLEEQEDYSPICTYLISMSKIYDENKNSATAMNYAQRSLQLALAFGLKEEVSKANEQLAKLYEKKGNITMSLMHYKQHILFRDSVNNVNEVQKIADLRTDYEVSKKQVEVDLLNQQKKNQRNILLSVSIILLLSVILLGTLYWFYKTISREKKRSEELLLNILPVETATELKQKGKVDAVKFDAVTVLFTDFYQFSKLAEFIEPEVLVASIDEYFKQFDEIADRYGLEKIKTIGDAYMCAGGLPTINSTHATDVVKAAVEINTFVNTMLEKNDELQHFQIRIGIHTGPVIAGIVGSKKWQYDIWGDTVNIAARMESACVPGRINLSEATYLHIRDNYACEYRGEIEVKNRGLLKMYFLELA
jgi:adenylate cyclase